MREPRGDTLVEVLICIAILAQVFTISYAMANHSLAEGINSSERSVATMLAQSQIEALKFRYQDSSNSVWTGNFSTVGLNFCLNTTANLPSDPNWLPNSQNTVTASTPLDTNAGDYNAACAVNNGRYYINISTKSAIAGIPSPTYLITVRWVQVGSSNQDLTQIYFRLPAITPG